MEKTSIKEISPRDIEKAFADAPQKLTGKEWSVEVNGLNFNLNVDELSLLPSSETAAMSLKAKEIRKPYEKDPSIPF
ncbi:hypothetical protein [Aquitalea aquatilis]|uniref:hypothetical protein n=1 Tax=Aquitalea aquatilis TaxID=1537400 RepID=UPI0010BCF336|nr:hypothetical protein [Aquitalea aquatilis]